MIYPLHLKAIDMVWSEIYDNEHSLICKVRARYADEVFAILNAAQPGSQWPDEPGFWQSDIIDKTEKGE